MKTVQNLITFSGISLFYIVCSVFVGCSLSMIIFMVGAFGFALGVECAMNEQSRIWFKQLPDNLMEI